MFINSLQSCWQVVLKCIRYTLTAIADVDNAFYAFLDYESHRSLCNNRIGIALFTAANITH